MTNKTKKSMQTTQKHMSKLQKEIYKIKWMMNKTQSIQKIKMITLKILWKIQKKLYKEIDKIDQIENEDNF